MIHYLVPQTAHRPHCAHAMEEFLQSWGSGLRDRIAILPYEDLPRLNSAAPGVYIFTHFEALTGPERRYAARIFNRLAAAGAGFRALNNPELVPDRAGLHRRLLEAGINDYAARRCDEPLEGLRFPVFLRLADEHFSWPPQLLANADELRAGLDAILHAAPGLTPHDVLAAEFCDTADSRGVYRKYSAMRIGPEILPRHILFSDAWVVKKPRLIDEAALAEEREFVRNFPHEELLRPVLDLAGVEFGRIDYGFRNGRLAVWEINTNPVLVPAPGRMAQERHEIQGESAAMLSRAFERLDASTAQAAPLDFHRPADQRLSEEAARHGRREGRRRQAIRRWMRATFAPPRGEEKATSEQSAAPQGE